MEANTGSLTTILHQLLDIFSLGQQGVAGSAFSLLTLLAGIELTLAALWWAITGRDGLVPLMRKILLLGFFVFVVQNYPTLLSIVVEGFIQTGKTASANGGDALASVRDPSTIIDAGFFVALPILDHLKSFGDWDVLFTFMTSSSLVSVLSEFWEPVLHHRHSGIRHLFRVRDCINARARLDSIRGLQAHGLSCGEGFRGHHLIRREAHGSWVFSVGNSSNYKSFQRTT